MYQIKYISLIGLLLGISTPGYALRSDREKPIDIRADEVEISKQQEISHYKGNVHLQQGSMNIHANRITVYLKQGKLERIVIDGGPATFEQLPEDRRDIVRSTAKNMEYFADKQLLLLKQNASVVQGSNHFSGDFIEYDTLNSTVKANKDMHSGSRVHAIIQPNEESKESKEPVPAQQPDKPSTEQSTP